MKILQIASSLFEWGGIERYVAYLSDGLEARGHEVFVACPPESPLACRVARLLALSQPAQFDIRTIPRWRALFREHAFDLAHVHFGPDFVIPARVAARSIGGPVVLTRHLATRWNSLKARAYARTFDRIVAVSDAVRASLVEASGIDPDKVVVAKAGCPAPKGRETADLGGATANVRVGFFGRLAPEKGVEYLVEAAQTLPEGVEVHIFGDGPSRPSLENADKAARCRFHGFVSEVEPFLHAVDIVVIPSVWAEAFPFAALEAMAAGKPIVASRAGGLPELVESGETGILVEPGAASQLGTALLKLVGNPTLRERMGEKARARHQEEFTVERFAERLEAVYTDVMAERNSRPR